MISPGLPHRVVNWLHSVLLLGGMALIAWVCVTALLGPGAGFWGVLGMAAAIALTPAVPREFVLSLHDARRLAPGELPEVQAMLRLLAGRAGLPRVPDFCLIPSGAPNAFALGRPGDGAVVVTVGLLRLLNRRELAGVLAHEMSHIAHRDVWIMGLADTMTRTTGVFALSGQFLILFNLPMALAGQPVIPWVVPLVLIVAPLAMNLMQLALSRVREYDADLGAARLTGDPMGLASALRQLEMDARGFWWRLFFPGRQGGDRSWLRTHPATGDRIARLVSLAGGDGHRARRRGSTLPARRDGGADPSSRPVVRVPFRRIVAAAPV